MKMEHASKVLRYIPSRADGLPDVREVVVHADRLEVNTEGRWMTIPFARIARRQESRVRAAAKRLLGRRRSPLLVADRDWFHPPKERWFCWYADPPLRTYMPVDEIEEYDGSCFLRIQDVLRAGRYGSCDVG